MKIQNLTFAILMSSAIMTATVTAQDVACGASDEELKVCYDIASDDQNVCVFRKITAVPYEPSAKEQKSKKIAKDPNGKKYRGSSKQKAAFKEWIGYWDGYLNQLSEDATLAIDGEKYACYPIESAEAQVGLSGTPNENQMTADYSIIPFTYVPPPPKAEPAAGGDGAAAGGDGAGAATTNAANAESDDGKIEQLWSKVQELEIYFQVLIIVGIVLVLLGFVMMCCCCKGKEIKDENKIMAKPIPTDSQKPTNKMDADLEKGSQEMELTSNMGD